MYFKQEIGKAGEDIATEYLSKKGYKIVERNFECKQGEIDIIATDKDEIVFVEVKTRSNLLYGEPAEAVDNIKQKHIKKAAEFYLYLRNLEDDFVRIDIIEIQLKGKNHFVNHIKLAFG